MSKHLVMVAVTRETRDKIKELAGRQPIYEYMRILADKATPYEPPDAISDRLARLESKVDKVADMVWMPDEVKKGLTITPEISAMVKQLYENTGVNSMDELMDLLMWHREHGDAEHRVEAGQIYHKLGALFGMPSLQPKYVDIIMRRLFAITEAVNNPVKPVGEG